MLDVGCGLGLPTIMLAEAFPNSTFVGVDYHDESIRLANAAAQEAGVADRVQFEVADATSYTGSHDLVLFFDAVHDFGDPVGARPRPERAGAGRTGRRGRAVRRGHPRGQPRQPDRGSVLRGQLALCVPHSVSEGGAALGAQAGPARLTAAFRDAGFPTARVAVATAYNLVIQATA